MSSQVKLNKPRSDGRQIVGFSLTPELVAEVKNEAIRRNISLKRLFSEMWALYKNSPAATSRFPTKD